MSLLNRITRHKSKIRELEIKDIFKELNTCILKIQSKMGIGENENSEHIENALAEVLCNSAELEYKVLGIINEERKLTNEILENKKNEHWFQIMVNYKNGDSYTYQAKMFEKIRKIGEEYVILIKGLIDTNELYDDEINGSFESEYSYEVISEIQLRKNDEIKNVVMLDGDTGREYELTYDMVDKYFSTKFIKKELIEINIIDILGINLLMNL